MELARLREKDVRKNLREPEVNVAEAERGMSREAAGEPGEEGEGQRMQAVVMVTELVSFHFDQPKPSAFWPFLPLTVRALHLSFSLACSALWSEGGADKQ